MSSIIQHISIPKSVATEDDLDFYFLREKGIQYIEELGGVLWTDSILMILESLCWRCFATPSLIWEIVLRLPFKIYWHPKILARALQSSLQIRRNISK